MHIISRKALKEFYKEHSDAEKPLKEWLSKIKHARWKSIADVRQTFPHADAVETKSGTLTVFNIGGNKYRLIARICYVPHIIYVIKILTHDDYMKENWKK